MECPVADFFASGWGLFRQINSLPVAVNPNRGYNCFWEMPFRKHCRITMENRHHDPITHYYQVNYTLTEVPDDAAYFHAQFRRTNPVPYQQPYMIVDGIAGAGQYVGTTMAWGVNNNRWWGEGEVKFFLDGDRDFPTLCGTGTEDYFGGAYNWDVDGQYVPFSHSVHGDAGVSSRQPLPVAAAVLDVPLARHGSGAVRARPAGHLPGSRLAQRGAPLSAAAG